MGPLEIASGVELATVCAENSFDTASVCAALFVEMATKPEAINRVKEQCGAEVASLASEVARLAEYKIRPPRGTHRAEQSRRIIVSIPNDIRVIPIRLALCVHEMRRIQYLPRTSQVLLAGTIFEVYAPLAHGIGLDRIRHELEDSAFKTLHPRKYAEIEVLIGERFAEGKAQIESAAGELSDGLAEVGIEADISTRIKSVSSIHRKMTSKGRAFNEIFDLVAMRVVVARVRDCYGTIGVVHSRWRPLPGRFKDFIAMPKQDMYQALHTTVIGPSDQPLEIQVQTSEMVDSATATHWVYKNNPHDRYVADIPSWLKHAGTWSTEADPQALMSATQEALSLEGLYVITPSGDVRQLPTGATPLDFAYALHTDIGDGYVGAEVNGVPVEMDHSLCSGDVCRVVTDSAASGPHADWLEIVRTRKARRAIRRFLSLASSASLEKSGRKLLATRLSEMGVDHREALGSPQFAALAGSRGYATAGPFYRAVGSGSLSADALVAEVARRYDVSVRKASEGNAPAGETIWLLSRHTRGLADSLALAVERAGVKLLGIVLNYDGGMVSGHLTIGKADPKTVAKSIETLRGLESVFDAYSD